MKKIIVYSLILLSAGMFWGCKKGNYPGAVVSPYISIFDIRNIFKGDEIALNTDNMFGAQKIAAVVVSNHTGGNMPTGVIMVQDRRRLNQLRGIAIPIGAEAANYVPGDSVHITVNGKSLKRQNNMLQLVGVGTSDIVKVASGVTIAPSIVRISDILSRPDNYESTLVTVTSAGFDPSYPVGSTYAGERIINDGFGNIKLFTETSAAFANTVIPYLANFTGVVTPGSNGTPQIRPRTIDDITILSALPPKIASFVITGYLADPSGTDANYEYMQFRATRNIDFSVTPFSVVTSNNAGTSTPTGFPSSGWATGGLRTYKFNITSGTVLKGDYFYVGGNKRIWGSASTDISSSKWFGKMYATVAGDGFGAVTTNLLANSGNAAGIAVFEGTNVTVTSVPEDVIFFGGSGNVFTAGPPERGYFITNTDYYDVVNPVTLVEQPYFSQGSNTGRFPFPTTSNFARLGGTYNKTTGRWTQARMQTSVVLTNSSVVSEIEGATTIEE
jgi:hypothetical protein